MTKEVSFIHAGFEDCEFLLRIEGEEELIEVVRAHAAHRHGVDVSPEHVLKIPREVRSWRGDR